MDDAATVFRCATALVVLGGNDVARQVVCQGHTRPLAEKSRKECTAAPGSRLDIGLCDVRSEQKVSWPADQCPRALINLACQLSESLWAVVPTAEGAAQIIDRCIAHT